MVFFRKQLFKDGSRAEPTRATLLSSSNIVQPDFSLFFLVFSSWTRVTCSDSIRFARADENRVSSVGCSCLGGVKTFKTEGQFGIFPPSESGNRVERAQGSESIRLRKKIQGKFKVFPQKSMYHLDFWNLNQTLNSIWAGSVQTGLSKTPWQTLRRLSL